MTTEQIFKDYWPVFAAAMGGVVWLIRLEGKQKQTDKNVDNLTEMHKSESGRLVIAIDKMAATQEKMAEQLNEMRTTLAGVVGYEKGAQEARAKRLR